MKLLCPEFMHGVYIPSALLIFGTYIIKKEWIPYTLSLVTVIGSIKIYNNRPRPVLHATEFQYFPLIEKITLSPNTAIYRFALPSKKHTLGLPIGQHISIAATLPGQNKEIMRSYTPITLDSTKGHFDLLVKSYPQGNISRYIANLKIGDSIKVRGPKGSMVYHPNMAKRIGMIAGGSGITPMLQIIRAIILGRRKNGGTDDTKVNLIFANVNEEDILLKDDLDKLSEQDDNFTIYYVLNNPPPGWTGGVGFVTENMVKEQLPGPEPGVKILLCGPPPMNKAMKAITTSLGYEKPQAVSKSEDQVFCF